MPYSVAYRCAALLRAGRRPRFLSPSGFPSRRLPHIQPAHILDLFDRLLSIGRVMTMSNSSLLASTERLIHILSFGQGILWPILRSRSFPRTWSSALLPVHASTFAGISLLTFPPHIALVFPRSRIPFRSNVTCFLAVAFACRSPPLRYVQRAYLLRLAWRCATGRRPSAEFLLSYLSLTSLLGVHLTFGPAYILTIICLKLVIASTKT